MAATILKEKDGEPLFRRHPNILETNIVLGIIVSFVYGFAIGPFKGFLFSHAWINIFITGSPVSELIGGAHYGKRSHLFIAGIFIGSLSILKFVPFYWAAGKHFGPYYIDAFIKSSPMVEKFIRRFESFIRKNTFVSILIFNIPFFPINSTILALIVGDSKVSLRKYISYTYIVKLMSSSLWFTMGILYGKSVLHVVNIIEKYMLYVTLVLTALIVFRVYKEYKKNKSKVN